MQITNFGGGGTFQSLIEYLPFSCKKLEKCYTSDMKHHFEKKNGFTLAEVLITLGVIGVVAALTLPSVISKFQNQAYIAALKKAYATVQNAHLRVVEENGEPKDWILFSYITDQGKDNSKNTKIADSYASYMVGRYCGHTGVAGVTDCISLKPATSFKMLNGQGTQGNVWYGGYLGLYHYTYQYNLSSGASLALLFAENSGGGVYWNLWHKNIKILYIIDVNGAKKPNQVGRDIYYFMLKDDKLQPYYDGTSDCKKGDLGFTCAYDVITNGWEFPKDYPY